MSTENQTQEVAVVATPESNFMSVNGQYGLDLISASPFGAFVYKFNGKGIDKDGEISIFTVENTPIIDSKGKLEESLDMVIAAPQPIYCKDFYIFNEDLADNKQWVELLFLNNDLRLSSLFLKGESMDNLFKLLKTTPKGEDYRDFWVKATREKKKSEKYGTYYVLKFERGENVGEKLSAETKSLFTDKYIKLLEMSARFPNRIPIFSRSSNEKIN